jgi:hypothetical protein
VLSRVVALVPRFGVQCVLVGALALAIANSTLVVWCVLPLLQGSPEECVVQVEAVVVAATQLDSPWPVTRCLQGLLQRLARLHRHLLAGAAQVVEDHGVEGMCQHTHPGLFVVSPLAMGC